MARGDVKKPEGVEEELAYYKALHELRESAADEDEANDALIAVYRRQAEFIGLIKPFMAWSGIARILGSTESIIRGRYQAYSGFEDVE